MSPAENPTIAPSLVRGMAEDFFPQRGDAAFLPYPLILPLKEGRNRYLCSSLSTPLMENEPICRPLSELSTSESGVIVKLLGHGSFRKRIAEMGFVR